MYDRTRHGHFLYLQYSISFVFWIYNEAFLKQVVNSSTTRKHATMTTKKYVITISLKFPLYQRRKIFFVSDALFSSSENVLLLAYSSRIQLNVYPYID